MANLTVTIAVATGTQYQVGGSGNVFTFDGSQPASYTFPWVNGGTVRLEQSGSTNDGHPLIFSTSNSTTLGTMQAGIISSGVTYYLDGSSNQSDYTNTTTFNAATTRYIEITPSSETDFYFACWVHGIGMGGIVDLTQNTWGALGWGEGEWSQQNVVTIDLTAPSLLTLSQGYAGFSEGWGRLAWGENDWGRPGDDTDVSVTGVGLTSSLGDETVTAQINKGWGRNTWGNGVWGDSYSVIPTGASATTSTGDVTINANSVHEIPTGASATASVGDDLVWRGDAYFSVTGTSATGSIGDVIVNENEVITLTGLGLTTSLGAALPIGPGNVSLTGIGLTASLGDERAFTDVTIPLSGLGLSSGLGTVVFVQFIPTPSVSSTVSLGTVSVSAKAVINPTGIGMTSSIGLASGMAFAWASVDTGTDVTWTEVDKTAA